MIDGWRPIQDAKPGRYLLYFSPTFDGWGKELLGAMIKVDTYPTTYPRDPSHFICIPEPPNAD